MSQYCLFIRKATAKLCDILLVFVAMISRSSLHTRPSGPWSWSWCESTLSCPRTQFSIRTSTWTWTVRDPESDELTIDLLGHHSSPSGIPTVYMTGWSNVFLRVENFDARYIWGVKFQALSEANVFFWVCQEPITRNGLLSLQYEVPLDPPLQSCILPVPPPPPNPGIPPRLLLQNSIKNFTFLEGWVLHFRSFLNLC